MRFVNDVYEINQISFMNCGHCSPYCHVNSYFSRSLSFVTVNACDTTPFLAWYTSEKIQEKTKHITMDTIVIQWYINMCKRKLICFSNSLIIRQAKTKEITTMKGLWIPGLD